jgi:hypothetical protein
MIIGRIKKISDDEYELDGVIYDDIFKARRALSERKTIKRKVKARSVPEGIETSTPGAPLPT